jgi:hypothetical protein
MSAEHPAILRSGLFALLHDFKISCHDWPGNTAEVLSKLTRIAIDRTRIVPRGRFMQA